METISGYALTFVLNALWQIPLLAGVAFAIVSVSDITPGRTTLFLNQV